MLYVSLVCAGLAEPGPPEEGTGKQNLFFFGAMVLLFLIWGVLSLGAHLD